MGYQLVNSSASAPRWGKADLHIHTRLSDGGPTPGQVIEHVVLHTDLDVIAITDHNRIEGGLRARDLAARHGLEVIVGEEVGTADGHLLALFIEEPLAPGRPIEETIAQVHAQGGLAIAAHPFDFLSSSLLGNSPRSWTAEQLLALRLDALEILNASLFRHMANARAEAVARQLGFATVGSSDAHHLAAIGQAYARFPGHTAEDLRRAILTHETAAGGRSWGVRQYLSWVPGCFIPRTIRRVYAAARARVAT